MMTMEGMFNISEAEETLISRSPTKKKVRSCFTLPMLRQNEINDLSVNMEAREAKIIKIEQSIHRIRETMSTKSSHSGNSNSIVGDEEERQQTSSVSRTSSASSSSSMSTESTTGRIALNSSESDCDGTSANSTKQSTTSSHSRKSREALRQKVRDKENALQSYIQRNSGVMAEVMMRRKQIEGLISTIEEKDATSEKLRQEVERLGAEIRHLEEQSRLEIAREKHFALSELDKIEQKVEAKDEQMTYYQHKLQSKESEVSHLAKELEEQRRRVIELEVSLETHDLRFASHEEYVRQVDKEALEVHVMEAVENDNDTGASEKQQRSSRHHAMSTTMKNQIYIQKLKSDLADMERRYMQEKTLGLLKVSSLEKENKSCRKRLVAMARHLATSKNNHQEQVGGNKTSAFEPVQTTRQYGGGTDFGSPSLPTIQHLPTLEYMKKRLDLVENENIEHLETITHLRSELKEAKASLQERDEKDNRELSWLRLENESLTVKIVELERDLEAMKLPISERQRQQKRREEYNLLEKKLDQSVVEILNLVEQVYAKDRAIASLRSTIVEERLARQEDDRAVDTAGWNDEEKKEEDSLRFALSKARPSSVEIELQSKLEACQKRLARKEEELRQIRGSSNRAADIPDLYFM